LRRVGEALFFHEQVHEQAGWKKKRAGTERGMKSSTMVKEEQQVSRTVMHLHHAQHYFAT
jgi:hypothetical protein